MRFVGAIAGAVLAVALAATLVWIWNASPNPPGVGTAQQPAGPLADGIAAAGLRVRFDPKRPDPRVDAIQMWRLGSAYFDPEPTGGSAGGGRAILRPVLALGPESLPEGFEFKGFDVEYTREFLEWPRLAPAVQFGCVVEHVPYEDALERALESDDAGVRVQALVLLMRVRAPRSVPAQWRALTALKTLSGSDSWRDLLDELSALFSVERLEEELRRASSVDLYDHRPDLKWAVRAAGVLRHKVLMPRLAGLSASVHLAISLAAERSLEDFDGPEADQALLKCMLAWRYDAYIRAGYALLKRNRGLLNEALSAVAAPENCRYQQGLLLAKCDNPKAVPILCAEVPRYQIIDGDMFDEISRLAGPEHAPLLHALPQQVRPEQRELAEAALEQYLRRMKEQTNGPDRQ